MPHTTAVSFEDDAQAHEMLPTSTTSSSRRQQHYPSTALTIDHHPLSSAADGHSAVSSSIASSIGEQPAISSSTTAAGTPPPPPYPVSSSAASTLPMHHQQMQRPAAAVPEQAPHPGYYERQPQRCEQMVRVFKWVPVAFIVAVIGWSYYAYVVELCFKAVTNPIEQVVYLIFYHIIFAMFVWSYAQTVAADVSAVPARFRLSKTDVQRLLHSENGEQHRRMLEQFGKDLPVTNRTYNGGVRFCDRCLLIKPDRAHHCSVCNQCVLKMDHHCPWVNNCVSFSNYKFFILFLGYALLYCLYVALSSLPAFVLFWQGTLEQGGLGRFHILFLFFVSVMFALSLCSLFGYHLYLVAKNRTTLEAFRAPIFRVGGPDKNGFHLGCRNNLIEVFGNDKWLWLVPLFSSKGTGDVYTLSATQRVMFAASDEEDRLQLEQQRQLREQREQREQRRAEQLELQRQQDEMLDAPMPHVLHALQQMANGRPSTASGVSTTSSAPAEFPGNDPPAAAQTTMCVIDEMRRTGNNGITKPW